MLPIDLTKCSDKEINQLDILLNQLKDDSTAGGESHREIINTCERKFPQNTINENKILAHLLEGSKLTHGEPSRSDENKSRQKINGKGLLFDSFKAERERQLNFLYAKILPLAPSAKKSIWERVGNSWKVFKDNIQPVYYVFMIVFGGIGILGFFGIRQCTLSNTAQKKEGLQQTSHKPVTDKNYLDTNNNHTKVMDTTKKANNKAIEQ